MSDIPQRGPKRPADEEGITKATAAEITGTEPGAADRDVADDAAGGSGGTTGGPAAARQAGLPTQPGEAAEAEAGEVDAGEADEERPGR